MRIEPKEEPKEEKEKEKKERKIRFIGMYIFRDEIRS